MDTSHVPDGPIRLLLAYDGTGFHGWARQRDPAIRTIQGTLEAELERMLQHSVGLSAAGRTDAGVHARGQVASFVTSSPILPARVQAALNGSLAPELVVREAAHVPRGFDARFSATARTYRYVLRTAPLADPFSARFEWHRPGGLSVSRMRDAARHLVGEHDFASFCRHPGGDRSTARRLQRLSVRRAGEVVVLGARADAFLHQMVRSLVGTLVAVGEGRLEPDEMPVILASRSRAAAGPVAPPHGLSLDRVTYGRRRDRDGE